MTATQTAPFGFPHTQLAFLRRTFSLFIKTCLALAIIFAAGIIAVATAAAGIALALVALMMRVFVGPRGETNVQEDANGQIITLEARKTPHGWTVE